MGMANDRHSFYVKKDFLVIDEEVFTLLQKAGGYSEASGLTGLSADL